MESEQPEKKAFEIIETELRAYEECEECASDRIGNARAEVAMAIAGYCRTYRRMRPAIETVLPTVQQDTPGVADLLRFLVMIADRACKAQITVQ